MIITNNLSKEKLDRINKAVAPTLEREKRFKTSERRKWWAEKWIDVVALFVSVLSLIVSLVAIIVAT